MASVRLQGVGKVYPNGVRALQSVDIDIEHGEFVVLVGPSGCGKTTLLRSIAGLEEITEGSILIDDDDVTNLPPQHRDLAMVFQNYALYPNMTVRENLGFGLRMRKTEKTEIIERVNSVAEALGLDDLLMRKPGALSGGQRQRVAMGRAMVREPRAFLMDEPLSNLDAKLRVNMRAELSRLHDRLGVTTIYVTHDQVEAMTLGQRVAVLRDGVLQQCATPQTLFDRPANIFVAAFIGSPAMNLIEAEVRDGKVRFAEHSLELGFSDRLPERVILGLRPTDFDLAVDGQQPRLSIVAEVVEELGSECLIVFSVAGKRVIAEGIDHGRTNDDEPEDEAFLFVDDQRTSFSARITGRRTVSVGERLELTIDSRHLHFFDPTTGLPLSVGVGP